MVLSIGMIVRDGEKYLEQCLTALQPIFKELDSELIIADTGSTDRTVEIAKKFTDKVYYFEWVNDFSAARNFTLDKAQGEWFLYIDQDEVAVDCSGLIKFFKSGEYRKYNTGAYVQRNLLSLDDPTHYTDFRQVVAAKRRPETRFVNEFHETLSPAYTPIKYLDFIVLHYGFAYAGEGGRERALAKSERNLKGLMAELEHVTDDGRLTEMYSEISDCYRNIGDFETALKYIDKGMEHADRTNNGAVAMLYTTKIYMLWDLDRYKEVIENADEYFDVELHPFRTKDFSSDCPIRAYKGWSCFALGRYREAISELVKFFELYRKYNSNKLLTTDLSATSWVIYEDRLKESYIKFFISCLHEKEYELADKYARLIDLDRFMDDELFMDGYIKVRVHYMRSVGFNNFGELYADLNSRGKEYLRSRILTDPENRDLMLKKLSALGGTVKEIANIYEAALNGKTDKDMIYAFLRAHGSDNYNDMLYFLLKDWKDIAPFVLTEDFRADSAGQAMISLFPDGIDLLATYNIKRVSPDGLLGTIMLYRDLLPRVLEKGLSVTELFEKYGALGLRWNSELKNSSEIPEDVYAAMLAGLAALAKRNKDRDEFVKALSDLKDIMPALADVADAYDRENGSEFPAPMNEFEKLAAEVKQNIRSLIAAENFAAAQTLLVEFRALCPDDPDIAVLAQETGGI